MAFPDEVLVADEEVVAHLRPQAAVTVRPIVVLLVAVAVVVVAAVLLPANPGGRTGVLVIGAMSLGWALVRGVWPLLVWRCTHLVLSTERLLWQDGVVSRLRWELPLAQVNDHVMRQGPLDRLLGRGTLTIDSVGEQEPVVLAAVPGVQRVQTLLYELVEQARERALEDEADADEEAAREGGRAQRLPG